MRAPDRRFTARRAPKPPYIYYTNIILLHQYHRQYLSGKRFSVGCAVRIAKDQPACLPQLHG
jgi:hypothetical protein